ncbi:hypothetical protein [uncultured Tenacibaculum sp.]|uniref:hypothetical protein n=1 Tax=uncultured Tenacibaculum sp. TaxID=174713 RepID=UPI00263353AF|nr:hypothetical protein [uncultured Tenacibaculum sp.]
MSRIILNNKEYDTKPVSVLLPLEKDPVTNYYVLKPDFLSTNEQLLGSIKLTPDAIPNIQGQAYPRPTAYIHGFNDDIPYYFQGYQFTEDINIPVKQIAVSKYWHVFFEGIILINDTDYKTYNVLDFNDQKEILSLCYPDGHPEEYTPYIIHNSTGDTLPGTGGSGGI